EEQAKADKAEKLAAEKEKAKLEAKKKEEEKARLALEDKKAADKDKSEAWVVQVASVSDKAKADALSSKLAGKGYRSRVVKNGYMESSSWARA
ncbi:MAG TPA: SPOR domain-containing protein, partial [Agitococcus sp.]|nr:SPOR domain-containing protein [Agitococcus sp.]